MLKMTIERVLQYFIWMTLTSYNKNRDRQWINYYLFSCITMQRSPWKFMVLVLNLIQCLILLLKDSPSRMINLMLLCCTWDHAIKHIEFVCQLCTNSTNQSLEIKKKKKLFHLIFVLLVLGAESMFYHQAHITPYYTYWNEYEENKRSRRNFGLSCLSLKFSIKKKIQTSIFAPG